MKEKLAGIQVGSSRPTIELVTPGAGKNGETSTVCQPNCIPNCQPSCIPSFPGPCPPDYRLPIPRPPGPIRSETE